MELILTEMNRVPGVNAMALELDQSIRSQVPRRYDMIYQKIEATIGDALGVDIASALRQAGQKMGIAHPLEDMKLGEVLEIAYGAYWVAPEAPVRAVTAGTKFENEKFAVVSPQGEDWHMAKCSAEQITFERKLPSGKRAAVASVSLIPLPGYGQVPMLSLARKLGTSIANGADAKEIAPPRILDKSKPPCAIVTHKSRLAPEDTEPGAGEQFGSAASRVCYGPRYLKTEKSWEGNLAIYFYLGEISPAALESTANNFFAGIQAK